jgi:hypothetical protein
VFAGPVGEIDGSPDESPDEREDIAGREMTTAMAWLTLQRLPKKIWKSPSRTRCSEADGKETMVLMIGPMEKNSPMVGARDSGPEKARAAQ